MEVFYSLAHLSTEKLRELYLEARQVGTHLIEYDKIAEPGSYEVRNFPVEAILQNINAANHNHFACVCGQEGEKDGITVGFQLTAYLHTTAYVEMDNALLGRFVEKYSLEPQPSNAVYSDGLIS